MLVERMVVEIDGDGEPVLMIHGLGGTANVWCAVDGAFGRHRRVRFDLPGSGRSKAGEGALSLELFVEKAFRVMDAAGAERAHVAAHSMGTIIAAHMAATQPRRIASLALFGPLLAPPDSARVGIRARAERVRVEGMEPTANALLQASLSTETRQKRPVAVAFVRELLMRQDPEGYARTCEALAEMRAADTMNIACPVLLVTGDEDTVAPPQSVRTMGERIKGSRVEVVRGCGHWTPVEKPEECVSLLNRFYTRRSTAWATSSSRTFA